MSERLRKVASAVGLCFLLTAGLVSLAVDAYACPRQEVEDTYYADATYQQVVGQWTLHCNCQGRHGWGRVTSYRERWVESCEPR